MYINVCFCKEGGTKILMYKNAPAFVLRFKLSRAGKKNVFLDTLILQDGETKEKAKKRSFGRKFSKEVPS